MMMREGCLGLLACLGIANCTAVDMKGMLKLLLLLICWCSHRVIAAAEGISFAYFIYPITAVTRAADYQG